jgi:hypothetical protein
VKEMLDKGMREFIQQSYQSRQSRERDFRVRITLDITDPWGNQE